MYGKLRIIIICVEYYFRFTFIFLQTTQISLSAWHCSLYQDMTTPAEKTEVNRQLQSASSNLVLPRSTRKYSY